jgi:hypothetical protein
MKVVMFATGVAALIGASVLSEEIGVLAMRRLKDSIRLANVRPARARALIADRIARKGRARVAGRRTVRRAVQAVRTSAVVLVRKSGRRGVVTAGQTAVSAKSSRIRTRRSPSSWPSRFSLRTARSEAVRLHA